MDRGSRTCGIGHAVRGDDTATAYEQFGIRLESTGRTEKEASESLVEYGQCGDLYGQYQ